MREHPRSGKTYPVVPIALMSEAVLEQSEKLGKYEIQQILGEGGMGIVYKAYDTLLQRHVAIKTIRRSLLEGRSGHELLERFRREARAEGKLVHPNIIMIHDYQESEGGMPFFVMEYIAGQDLKQHLSRGVHFELEKSLAIIEQVLDALAYSHRQGIVHRDIKPANIILLEDDSVKIADFGIAKMEESEYTQTGLVMGTPQYIAPEQMMGQKIDGRSDLYSCGAVLYELLTGAKAHAANKDTTLLAGLKDLPEHKLDTKDPLTQRLFKKVLVRALAPDPNDRFATAEEFIAAIQSARPQLSHKHQVRHHRLMIGVLASLLAITTLGGYYWVSTSRLEPKTSDNAAPVATAGSALLEAGTPTRSNAVTPAVANPDLTEEQQLKIENHLRVARIHLLVGRLVLPPGSNAYHSYQLVLDIDPTNQAALSGLTQVQQDVSNAIRQRLADGDQHSAREQLSTALRLFPEDAQLQQLKRQIL